MDKKLYLPSLAYIMFLMAIWSLVFYAIFEMILFWRHAGIFVLITTICFFLSFIFGILAVIVRSLTGTKLSSAENEKVRTSLVISSLFLGGVLLVWHSYHVQKRNIEFFRMSELKNLAEVILDYSAENEGLLPNADTWTDVLFERDNRFYDPEIHGPKSNYKGYKWNYAFNENISGMKVDELPGDIVLFFEAKGGLNLSGSQSLIESRKKFKNSVFVILLDKTIQKFWLDENICKRKKNDEYENVSSLRWKP